MDFILVLVVVFAILFFARRTENRPVATSQPSVQQVPEPKREATDEDVSRADAEIERWFTEEVNFPDGPSGADMYAHRHLMRPWYWELVSKFRYDDKMRSKIKEDFIEYIYAVKGFSTSAYLAGEFYDKEDGNKYDEESRVLATKIRTIMKAFAKQMGPEGEKLLQEHSDRGFMGYNRLTGEILKQGEKWMDS